MNSQKQRYFSRRDLELLQRNPFFHVDLDQIRKIGEDAYFADVHYVYPESVKTYVSRVIEEGVAMIEGARSDTEVVLAVLKLQYALLSIHPFSDGNGRVIRLVTVWLLRSEGLAVPLRPITNELNLTLEEQYAATVHAMNAYIKVYQGIEQ